QHADRLAQHCGFGLDATHSPGEYTQAVHHGRVRVRSHARIWVRLNRTVVLPGHHRAGEVLQVHLVHNSGSRGHHFEVIERGLSPAEELVALTVAFIFDFNVALEGLGITEYVHDDGVVNDEFGGCQRVNFARVPA